jgi:hypothetical protein
MGSGTSLSLAASGPADSMSKGFAGGPPMASRPLISGAPVDLG